MIEIDSLTVLHNEKSVRMFDSHIKLFRSRASGDINLNFKVSCDLQYQSLLPDDVEIFKYEKIPSGSIDHAYNMQTLLNCVETKWFCMMDPDVYPSSNGWDTKVLDYMQDYDVFGIPYSCANRFYDFPMLHLIFFDWNSFIKEVDRYNLRNIENENWSIFMPHGPDNVPSGWNEALCPEFRHLGSLISKPNEISRKVISYPDANILNEYYTRYPGTYTDTGWKMPVVFKDLKSFCFKESTIHESELDKDAGRTGGGRQSFKYLDIDGNDLFVHLVYATNC